MALIRDRLIVIAGLGAITALAWVYVVYLASGMTGVEISRNVGTNMNSMEMSMPNLQAWQSGTFVLTFIMWAVMMVAMMTPSATPMILMFARVNRQRHIDHTPVPATTVFLLGYLLAWFSFS